MLSYVITRVHYFDEEQLQRFADVVSLRLLVNVLDYGGDLKQKAPILSLERNI